MCPWASPLPAPPEKRKPGVPAPGKLPLARCRGRAYVSKRSNGVPDAMFRGPAERQTPTR
ncbi:hypothetical protein MesoLj131a_12550 [Mesorhizobium sp. 131-2-1]|nr:hypothetical protein MesoLj131a_12550 [Mesorhizobium sp. 131-2-1]